MRMSFASRLIFTMIGVSLPVAAHAADMNHTHIYNPDWPPHAKFHDGQTLSLSIALGGLTTLLAWKSSKNVPGMVLAAGGAASLYFVTQSTAILYPNTDYSDAKVKPTVLGVPAAHVIDAVFLSATLVATWLGLRGARHQYPLQRDAEDTL